MTFLVRQLEEQGLIARRTHPKDQRAVLLRLTPRGRRVADNVIAAMADADKAIVVHVRRRDRQAAERLLLRLQRAVESVT
jgi:DNA-binding MarR family transcriptional regulator